MHVCPGGFAWGILQLLLHPLSKTFFIFVILIIAGYNFIIFIY